MIHGETSRDLKVLVERFERDIIKRALAENRGNVLQTSRILGLTRTGLTNKIKRYKIVLDYNKIVSD